ncbi:hypothetical protein [Nocardia vaccinii]|uniref:hypothetical protein n=1 Tax=Nocardia vaccinii TaxID=1822 RepID=UPI000B0AB513|nr:hypothetical protein [Nocardia vaccinii]
MSDAYPTDVGCGNEPSRHRRSDGAPPEDLLAYVRQQVKAGKRVGREAVRKRFGVSREQIDKARKQVDEEINLPVAERVKRVRTFLADPHVYKVIEQDIKTSQDRRLRARARVVHADLAKRQRDAEAELRELQNAKSPFEATVKAELELNKAAQFVHAVGESIDDMPQPDRLADALRDLAEQVATVLEKLEPPMEYEVIDSEAWPIRSTQAELM